MSEYFIYAIIHFNKIIYIGSTRDFEKRIRSHEYNFKKNRELYLYKYISLLENGFEDVDFLILKPGLGDDKEKFEDEKKTIVRFRPVCNTVYNCKESEKTVKCLICDMWIINIRMNGHKEYIIKNSKLYAQVRVNVQEQSSKRARNKTTDEKEFSCYNST